jgi:hypothetical protein
MCGGSQRTGRVRPVRFVSTSWPIRRSESSECS